MQMSFENGSMFAANQQAVSRIMVGPGSTQSFMQSNIARVVKENRLKEACIVSCSQIPYREW
jgi:hypothetical protein